MIDAKLLNMLAAPELPGPSHDGNDVLLRDVVSIDHADLDAATHVIIGCPQDMGVARNHGRPGAARAPGAIRGFLHRLKPAVEDGGPRIVDLGDVDVSGELEQVHERQRTLVEALIKAGKTVVVLGGGNDISFPDASAMHAAHPDYAAINMDAHLDMRRSEKRHSGTPYRNLIDAGRLEPRRFHETGIQGWANSPRYLAEAREMGVNIHYLRDIHDEGPRKFFTRLFDDLENMPLFAGLDMDCVRASDAPGVSASCPVGFSAKTVMRFAHLCRAHGRTRIFEITEVNPAFDRDGRTARLAALAVYVFIYGNR